MNDKETKVISIIKSHLIVDVEVDLNTDLRELGIDSLILVRLIVEIERSFNIEIDDDSLSISNYSKVYDFYKLIE